MPEGTFPPPHLFCERESKSTKKEEIITANKKLFYFSKKGTDCKSIPAEKGGIIK